MALDGSFPPSLNSTEWENISCNIGPPQVFWKTVVEPVITFCGIVGIILTMIVLSRKTMCTSTNCYLMALAVADLLFLLLLFMTILVERYAHCSFRLGNNGALLRFFSTIFMEIFFNLTIGVTVMLAVERYIAICHPMRAMTICTVRRARVIIAILFVVSVILRLPRFFQMEITYLNGETIFSWRTPYNEPVYNYIVAGALTTALPLVSLLALNIRLIVEIHRSTRYLQYHLGAHQHVRSVVSNEEIKITLMLVSVVIAFFVCHVPYMVYSCMQAFAAFDTSDDDDLATFQYVVHCLLALKSSCNFILYCWFSEKFWTTFKRLFCLRHCLPRQAVRQPNGCNNASHNNSNNNSHNNVHRPSWYITRETTC